MEKLLVVYSKSKEAIYLSHLDTMAVFQDSLSRANIQVKYSNGFNPRPDIVFAHPLSVGIESIGEILEVTLMEKIEPSYFIKYINNVLPSGLTVLNAEYIDINNKSIMSRVYSSIYQIEFIYNSKIFDGKNIKQVEDIKKEYQNKMLDYLDQEYLLVLKKSKNRMERIDIKPQILDYMFTLDGNFQITVETGPKSNLKPEYIMIGYNEYVNDTLQYNIKRTKILYQ